MIHALSGCQAYLNFAAHVDPFVKNRYPQDKCLFLIHRSPMVSGPAFYGYLTGYIVAAPLSLSNELLFGSTYRKMTGITFENNKDDAGHISEFPSVFLGAAGEYMIGVPCWLMFGWWWPEPIEKEPCLPQEKTKEQGILIEDKIPTNPKSP